MASPSSANLSAIALASPLRNASAKALIAARISFSSPDGPAGAAAGSVAGATGASPEGLSFGGSSAAESVEAASSRPNQAESVVLMVVSLPLGSFLEFGGVAGGLEDEIHSFNN